MGVRSQAETAIARTVFCLLLLLNVPLNAEHALATTTTRTESSTILNSASSLKYEGHPVEIKMSTEGGLQLYQHWLDQALSGLMAAVANKRMTNLPEYAKDRLVACSKQAHTVHEHAKCVNALIEIEKGIGIDSKTGIVVAKKKKTTKKSRRLQSGGRSKSYRTGFHDKSKNRSSPKSTFRKYVKKTDRKSARKQPMTPVHTSTKSMNKASVAAKLKKLRRKLPSKMKVRKVKNQKWQSPLRRSKRSAEEPPARFSVIKKNKYRLISEMPEKSPFGIVAKYLTETVRSLKKKKEKKSWRQTLMEIQIEGKKAKERRSAKEAMKRHMEMLMIKGQDDAQNNLDERRPLAMKKLEVLEEFAGDEKGRAYAEAKQMEKQLTPEQKAMRAPMQLMRDGIKLAKMLHGEDVAGFENKTVRLISPRFMSLVPDEESGNLTDVENVLSPSLFALHNEGVGWERNLSVNALLGGTLNEETEELLNFIVEASGVSDAIDHLKEEKVKKEGTDDLRGPQGEPLYFTKDNITTMFGEGEKHKIEIFERLQETYSPQQMDEFKRLGYSTLNDHQLELVYGQRSPYANNRTLGRLRAMNVTSADALDVHMDSAVDELAREARAFRVRRKDIVGTPILFTAFINDPKAVSQSIILSPVLFSPLIQSPAILGIVLLSPWMFVPVIASPRLLFPVVLSPIVLSPIVLSPLAALPVILSPGVMVPVVLSPLVMTPFVLSPLLLTPVILSPFALSPFIASPTALSPIILSPFVLSPSIFSPVAFTGVILSPYALSPSIQSNATAITVFGSPSWLS